MREHAWLARLPAVIGETTPAVSLGIGDDCAVLDVRGASVVWTIDTVVENVHFTRAFASLEDIGFRAVMAAASDIAAMGGRPTALLSSLIVPSDLDDEALDAVVLGERGAAIALGAPIVGGNVSRGTELSVTISVLGDALAPLTRAGARAGDRVWLHGPVGLAAAGLAALRRDPPIASPALDLAIAAWRRPVARVTAGLAIASRATAAIDVSDGLAQDAGHVARASGVTLELDADACVDASGPALRDAARALALDPHDLALAGGEDYALLVTSPHDLRDADFTAIGIVREGPPTVTVLQSGRPRGAPPGWNH